jgi:hypothetical protein
MFPSWQAWLRRTRLSLSSRCPRVRGPKRRARAAPALECLEDRTAPAAATFSDSGHLLTIGLVAGQSLQIQSTWNGSSGSYTFTLASGDTWSGTPTANESASGNVLTVNSTGIGALNGGISIGDSGSTGGDSVSFSDSGSATYANNLSILLNNSTAGVTLNGSSTFSLGLHVLASPIVTVNSGTDKGPFTLNGAPALQVNSGGALDLNGGVTSVGSFNGSGTVTNSSSTASGFGVFGGGTFSGNITGNLALEYDASSTLTLSGANTYSGGTTLDFGTLALGSSGALGTTGTITFAGGTLQYSSSNTTDYSSRFSTAASQQYSIDTNGQGVTFASALTSSGGSLTKLGSGTLTLTGSNGYGTTTISGGTLQVGNGGTSGTLGTGSVTDNATLFIDLSSSVSVANAISGSGGIVQLTSGGSISQTAAITASTVTASAAGGITLNNSGNAFTAVTATDNSSSGISLATTGSLGISGITESSSGNVSVKSTGSDTGVTVNGNVTTAGGSITLQATGGVTVAANKTVNSGTGTLLLGADLTSAGAGDNGTGALTINAGATVTSTSSSTSAITLRGADISIDTGTTTHVGAAAGSTTASLSLGGLTSPRAVAVDGSGNVYIANFGSGGTGTTVSRFTPGSTAASVTLTGLSGPAALAFDSSGNLYVANTGNNTVSKFAASSLATNNATPSATLTGVHVPSALAFDSSGNLYVANYGDSSSTPGKGTTVSKFAPGATTPSATLTGLTGPVALAFDSGGNLYVANYADSSGNQGAGTTVSKFNSSNLGNNATPSSTLSGLSGPAALAVDSSNNLHVANTGAGTVSKFNSSGTLTATLTGLSTPQSLAFDSSGNLYVDNGGNNTVSRFVPGATTASTTFTGLTLPVAIAFDKSNGYLYAANSGDNSVSRFTVPGQAGGVVIRSSQGSQAIFLGSASGTGINLSSAELARIATIAGGTVTIGDSAQTGNINFKAATVATTTGANTAVVQSTSGGGQMALDATGSGAALNGNGGTVTLTPGTGLISGTLSTSNALISSNGFTASGLTFIPSLSSTLSSGAVLTLVNDTGSAISGTSSTKISGTTATLNQGDSRSLSFNSNNYTLYASYHGSSGSANDLVLIDGTAASVTNPSNQTVTEGGTATFTVTPSGTPTPSVQWQVSTDGTNYTNLTDGSGVSGSTTSSLQLSGVTRDMNGYSYRAVVTNTFSSATSAAATLTVNYAPSVTTDPTSTTVTAGGSASFTITDDGRPTPAVKWQVSSDNGSTYGDLSDVTLADGTVVSGSTTTTLSLSNVAADLNGFVYRAKLSNSVQSGVTSNGATLTVQYAPSVTTQPSSTSVAQSSTATFTAAASGNPAPAVEWDYSSDGTSFTPLSDGSFNGATVSGSATGTLTVSNATAALDGYLFEAVFTNTFSGTPHTATSNAAALSVTHAPSVTTQPTSTEVAAGTSAQFTAAASGNPSPGVQWQVSTNGGTSYGNLTDGNGVSGSSTGTLTLSNVTSTMNGNLYRAVFTNSAGSTNSNGAALAVDFAPGVTTQPTSTTVTAGNTATFTAAASGNPAPAVQWSYSSDGTHFTALADGSSNGATVSGSATGTLTVSSATAALDGYLFEAVFTNTFGGTTHTAISNAATLTVDFAPGVTTNPTSTEVAAGSGATFTAAASGNPTPNVRWQVSTNGGTTYTNITGATSSPLILSSVTPAMNGNLYRAVFSNGIGIDATTTAATLAVDFAPGVTSQPANKTVTAGSSTSFTAGASGNPAPAVQWQVSSNTGTSYSPLSDGPLADGTVVSGSATTTLSLSSIGSGNDGHLYRAVFTNSQGSATSNAATLTVNYAPIVTTPPTNQSALAGNSARFTAAASANPGASVKWQVSKDGGSSFGDVPGANSTTLTVTNITAGMNGWEYEAVFTNAFGSTPSSPATLLVTSAPTVTASTASLPATSTTVEVFGTGFDLTPGNDVVTFSNSGVTGTVTAVTSTNELTVTFDSGVKLTGGPLFASIAVDTVSSGPAVEVAGVAAVVNSTITTPQSLLASATTVTITGTGFDSNPANDLVTFSGSASGLVTVATPTTLTVTGVTGLVGGALDATVTVNGVSSGATPVQVATVTPVITSSTLALAANGTTLTISGYGFDSTTASDLLSFSGTASGQVTQATLTQLSLTSLTGLTVGPLTASVSVDGAGSGPAVQVAVVDPVVTSSTANLTADQTSLTINGFGFDGTTPGNNLVTFSGGATGTVTASSATTLTVTGLTGLLGGPLTATVAVTVGGTSYSSPTPVEVAAVVPVLTASATNLPASSTQLTITGFGFDAATPGNNVVTFSGGATGTVTAATSTSLTVTSLAGLGVGPLFASVEVDNNSRSAAVQVATVASVITPTTPTVTADSTTLTITGIAFDTTPSHDVVTLSGGATGLVTAATSTQLTVTGVSGLVAGPLYASLLVDGICSGSPVEIAVVSPVVTASTMTLLNNATTLTINGFGFSSTAANNTVSFSGGVSGRVTAATLTQLTVTSLSGSVPANGLPLGSVTASVTSNAVGSGAAVQVATVVRDTVSAAQSTVMLASSSIQSGSTTTVTLTARDAGGLQVPGSATVIFSLGTGIARGTFSSVTTIGDGTFTATFTGTIAGSNTITGSIDGVALTSAAPTVAVSPGPVSLATSSAAVFPAILPAGGQGLVTLTVRDAAGNQQAAGGLSVTFGVGGGAGGATFAATTDNHDGTYTAVMTATTPGGNVVVASIGGQAVTSSAPAFTVLAVSPLTDRVVAHTADPVVQAFQVSNPHHSSSLSYAPPTVVTASSVVQQRLALVALASDGSYATGDTITGAKWLQSTSGTDVAGDRQHQYYLLPSGELHFWDGSASDTGPSTLVASLGTAVYNNPTLLLTALVAPTAFNLETTYGFAPLGGGDNYATGDTIRNARWLKSTSGTDVPGDQMHQYFLLPDGTLHFYDGNASHTGASTLVAALVPAYYQDPQLLVHAVPPALPAGVTASYIGTPDNNGLGVLQIAGFAGITGAFGVQMSVNDGVQTFTTSFLVTVTDAAPTLSLASLTPPSTLTPVPTATTPHSSGSVVAQFTGGDADPNETLTYASQVVSLNYAVEQQLALVALGSDGSFATGDTIAGAKWLQSTNGSNGGKPGLGQYYLLPGGELHFWDGNASHTGASTLVAALDPSAYADPALLLTATTAGLAFTTEQNLALVPLQSNGGYATGDTIPNAKWLKSTNGHNAANGGQYYLLPDGSLHQWDGNTEALPDGTRLTQVTSPVVAQLAPIYYQVPQLLLKGQQPSALPGTLQANVAQTGNNASVTFTGYSLLAGTYGVLTSLSDLAGDRTTTQIFLVTVTDAAPALALVALTPPTTLTPVATATTLHSSGGVAGTFSGSDAEGDALTNSAQVVSQAYAVEEALALNPVYHGGDYDRGDTIGGAKWFISANGSNAGKPGMGQYFLLPDGTLHAWDGNASHTGSSTQVAALGAAVYNDPTLLLTAPLAQAAYNAEQSLALTSLGPHNNFATGDTIAGAQWFRSTNGGNAANGGQYFLLPDGTLHAWDGITERLPDGTPITPYSSPPVATLSPIYNDIPLLLVNAQAPAPLPAGLTANASPGNGSPFNATASGYSGLLGTFGVSVSVTDQVFTTTRDFLVAVTDSPPALAHINDQTVAHNAPSPQLSVPVSATDPDAADQPNLTYSALVFSDALGAQAFQVQQQLGLVALGGPGNYATGDTIAGAKWLQSTTGSDVAGDRQHQCYLLPSGELHFWDGSASDTGASTLVATFSAAYYNDPTMLLSPAQAGVTAGAVGTGSSATLTFDGFGPYAGTTLSVYATASDGAMTSAQLFRVTVT